MNTRRTIGQRRGVAAVGNNQVPPQALDEGVVMPIKPAGFADEEMRASLDQMTHAITM